MQEEISYESMSKFAQLIELSRGSYGIVYRCLHLGTNKLMVLKQQMKSLNPQGFSGNSLREMSLLKKVKHINVIQLKGVFVDHDRLYFVFDFMQMDFGKYLKKLNLVNTKLTILQVKKFLKQILLGIEECHSKFILHRDLKPVNILIDTASGNIKIADFGLARSYTHLPGFYTQQVVTACYRAPQIFFGAKYSTPVDIWSIGCIFAEMLTGRMLFPATSESDLIDRIIQLLGTPTEQNWPGVSLLSKYNMNMPNFTGNNLQTTMTKERLDDQGHDLLKKMLCLDPKNRISATAALAHLYLQNID